MSGRHPGVVRSPGKPRSSGPGCASVTAPGWARRRWLPAVVRLAAVVAWAVTALACAQQATTPAQRAAATAARVDAETWASLLTRARAAQRQCGFQVFAAAGPVEWNDALARAARAHSSDMAETGQLSHTGSRGQDLEERVRSAGYEPRAWGENVAYGQPDPESVLVAWLDSPGHCRNIMDPDYREVGAARARARDGRPYWTLVLAAPMQ